MTLSRRQLLAALAALPAAAQDRNANRPAPRLKPPLCLYSEQISKVGYDELGGVLRLLGFDGAVIGVLPGGHIAPDHADLNLMRSVEAMTGVGMDVAGIAIPFTASPQNQTLRLALWVAGEMGVPCLRPGPWKYTEAAEIAEHQMEVQRDLSILAAMARQVGTAIAIHNSTTDVFDAAVSLLAPFDSRFIGFDFDPSVASSKGGPEACALALNAALPRLKMVTVRDLARNKDAAAEPKLTPCPLGQGIVDWPAFFGALARASYTGPVTLYQDYHPADELGAIRKDMDFLKKQLAAAYAG